MLVVGRSTSNCDRVLCYNLYGVWQSITITCDRVPWLLQTISGRIMAHSGPEMVGWSPFSFWTNSWSSADFCLKLNSNWIFCFNSTFNLTFCQNHVFSEEISKVYYKIFINLVLPFKKGRFFFIFAWLLPGPKLWYLGRPLKIQIFVNFRKGYEAGIGLCRL